MVTANDGCDPSAILWRNDAETIDDELLPYPTSPRRPEITLPVFASSCAVCGWDPALAASVEGAASVVV